MHFFFSLHAWPGYNGAWCRIHSLRALALWKKFVFCASESFGAGYSNIVVKANKQFAKVHSANVVQGSLRNQNGKKMC